LGHVERAKILDVMNLKNSANAMEILRKWLMTILMICTSVIGFFIVRELKANDEFKQETKENFHQVDERLKYLEGKEKLEAERWRQIEKYMQENNERMKRIDETFFNMNENIKEFYREYGAALEKAKKLDS
jgi:preprotein translocase subunit SecF